jgi:hypothetical protein
MFTSAGPCKTCCAPVEHVEAGESVMDEPVPGRLYRIRRFDTLIGIARRAYGRPVGHGMNIPGSQKINDANPTLHRPPQSIFDQSYYPGGRISFNPPYAVIRIPA